MIKLPQFTFLSGPPESGKSTIADLLASQDTEMCRCSIAEPIRMSLLSTFYPDQMTMGIDLRDGAVKASLIPGTGITHRRWMISFSEWMKSLHGKQIFGDLAKRQCELQDRYYARFVFDDSRFAEEIRPFALAYGPENILIVHVSRAGAEWGDDLHTDLKSLYCHHAAINNNGTPEDAIRNLGVALGQPETARSKDLPQQLTEGEGLIEPSKDEL